ncbi:hypothetical protein [Flavobacterium litorale]|uniref:Uncharacterized protein n=1 Tax=Flavobacterium litorale TaxID=2856519 RepID=A0ABX8VB32_9FLAO|nr:hypothetical protein [Flavobacterium litorale]QYJ68020.1 hypothetical protein K1I41_10855 [Flavobacterium litorale]
MGLRNIITLQTAQKWARRWRRKEGNYNSHHELHAFLIPKEDLTQVLVEGVDAVRTYIGVDDDNVEKLMIVGTKYDETTDSYIDMTPDRSDGKIYDFTRPCPPSCDVTSPLN